MQSRKYVFIILVISLAACLRVNNLPTAETTPVAKVLTENPCDYLSMEQAEKPAFKGMELYSWQEPKDGDWVFSILYGTNRNKMIWEVKSNAMDLEEVEKCLCNMPENENVFWMKFAQEETTGEGYIFPQPPDEIVDEVEKQAILCKVKLNTFSVRNNVKNE